MYQRPIYQQLTERLREPRQRLQVMAGPRQVGKSTLIAQVIKGLNIPSSLEVADNVPAANTHWIAQVWETARTRMDLKGESERLLVIDEIQKLDNWSEAVKREWDRDTREGRQLKVVLLGSSRLLIMRGLSESLAGRFELLRIGHWDYAEMRDAFGWTLDKYVYFGGYPGSAAMTGNETRWRNYVRDALAGAAITKDVLLTSNVYKPALLRQLFEVGCTYSAQLLSLNKMIGQLQDAGNVTTLAGYLQLLDEGCLLKGLSKYAADNARKHASIPKYQVYNNALRSAYTATTFNNARTNPQLWGRWVESAVGAHLINHADADGYKVYYWRDKDQEVDFVLEQHGQLAAIEVKSGADPHSNGLTAFTTAFHPMRTLIVGAEGMPLEEFLQIPPAQLLK